MSKPHLVEHAFRHAYGQLVAGLVRRFGVERLEAVEDAVQSAMLRALERWTSESVPDEPTAWLFAVAHNHAVSALRTQAGRERILATRPRASEPADVGQPQRFAGEVDDDLLRMLLVCCDPAIGQPSQLALALKTVCGFSCNEIAVRLFSTPAGIYKRLARARAQLRSSGGLSTELGAVQAAPRVEAVESVLYLLFTEGYLSSHAEFAIRWELCQEAIRLATLLASHPLGRAPRTRALVALMHLHIARMPAREHPSGGLVLLEEQDRSLWDPMAIATGLHWLAQASEGDTFSRFHAEASVAAEHCLAPSFEETRWDRVVESYEILERQAPSALHRLNRAVAVAQLRGARAGLEILHNDAPPSWLAGSHMWAAVLSDLHRRCEDTRAADRFREAALKRAPSEAIRMLLQRRLGGGEPVTD